MKNDEEIQKNIEAGEMGNSSDEKAYRYVFNALPKEKGEYLTQGFADRVASRIQQRTSESSLPEIMLAIFGGLAFIIGLVVTIAMTGFKPNLGFLNALSNYKGLFLFGIVFIILINVIDRQVLRKKEFA